MFTVFIAGDESCMADVGKNFRDELKKKIKESIDEGSTNVVSAVNVGGKGQHTSVSAHQRVVHRDGVTTTVTEKHEERSADG